MVLLAVSMVSSYVVVVFVGVLTGVLLAASALHRILLGRMCHEALALRVVGRLEAVMVEVGMLLLM